MGVRLVPLVVLLAAVLSGCVGDPQVASRRLPPLEHIVLVTIDTLRADHTSAYGYPVQTTPWLDELAARGIVFRRAYAQSATTKPSHASLFTGLYPVQHGVQNNIDVLDHKFETLAEMLRGQGYRTAAFVSADAPLGGNVGQGFEHWDQPQLDDRQPPTSLYRSAGATVGRAIDWLQSNVSPDEKLFLWVHVYDPHRPMNPPPEHRREVERLIRALGRQRHVETLLAQDIPADDPRGYDRVVDYDAEIRYADTELQRLYRSMDAAGLNGDGLWIVTADHGQGLGAHGRFGHSLQIYNAQLHVPLVFWFTEGTVPARDIGDQVVELVDILPTIADLVEGAEVRQIGPIRGRSLLPFLRGESPRQSKHFAYAERSRYVNPSPARLAKPNHEPGSRYAYQDLEYMYLLFTEGPDELYHLSSDPYEIDNVIDDPAHAEHGAQLRELLIAMLEETTTDRTVGTVSEEEIERLRALGYIQ